MMEWTGRPTRPVGFPFPFLFASDFIIPHHTMNFFIRSLVLLLNFQNILSLSTYTSKTVSFRLPTSTREEVQTFMDDVLMPKKSYSERIGLGRDAQGIDGSSALNPDDPRLEKTYAEFPLSSLDQLIDSSFKYLENDGRPKNDDNINFVDIGSG